MPPDIYRNFLNQFKFPPLIIFGDQVTDDIR
jgi:hypothetical protein